jgi:hypothetical protein
MIELKQLMYVPEIMVQRGRGLAAGEFRLAYKVYPS